MTRQQTRILALVGLLLLGLGLALLLLGPDSSPRREQTPITLPMP